MVLAGFFFALTDRFPQEPIPATLPRVTAKISWKRALAWGMRGTLHLLTPEDAGAFLSLIASGRSWERPSWQKYFGVTPKQLDALREVIRETLAGKVLTREELIGA